ncbi:hypothetical protein SBA7_1680007 [Candidatus Sulfotelmatobacter sp. SbA7]|nr:hypothetical protein SBA7_1680007 [Candidatus Sulfotelmatobacter sp. SbA7]
MPNTQLLSQEYKACLRKPGLAR